MLEMDLLEDKQVRNSNPDNFPSHVSHVQIVLEEKTWYDITFVFSYAKVKEKINKRLYIPRVLEIESMSI